MPHSFMLSRLPFPAMVEGRVLLHAEDEVTGRRYLLLEGTDAKVHLIYHTDRIEEARRAGKLAVNSFVRLEKQFVERDPHLVVSDYGDANALLENPSFLKRRAKFSPSGGNTSEQNAWGGWLGQYYAGLQGSIERNRARLYLAR